MLKFMKSHGSRLCFKWLIIFLGLVPSKSYCQILEYEEPLIASIRSSIIKINAVYQNADNRSPWLFSAGRSVSGSGFFVEGRRLITNAHVVSNARFITVQKDGDPRQYNAYVEYIAHDCDLAVLNLKESDFFKGLKPLTLGDVPKLRSPVSTLGYPTGGEQIAVTKGVVSRIDFSLYAHTDYHFHLLIQVDSAINSGASGGPVLQNGKVIGVAFQAFRTGQNIGFIIPVPIIKRFLKDISSGSYKGHSETGLIGRPWLMGNEATSTFHGVNSGFKISEVTEWSPYKDKIRAGDILLEVDGQKIGADGNISYKGERISLYMIFDLKLIGESVRVKLKRKEDIIDLSLSVLHPKEHPFMGKMYLKHPRYVVSGGLVFTELTQNYFEAWGEEWLRKLPLFYRYIFSNSDQDEEFKNIKTFIVLSKRLPDKINEYSDEFQNSIVKSVNDKKIHSFEEFRESLKNLSRDFLKIEFYDHDEVLYLPTKGLKESNMAINKTYGVQPESWFDSNDGAISWKQ